MACEDYNAPLVARVAPDFTAQAVMADDSTEAEFNLHKFIDKSDNRATILFFYPLDFTFVCPTELLSFENRIEEFSKLDVSVISVSVDSPFVHKAWRNTPINQGGIGRVKYPMVSDMNHDIAKKYGVYLPSASVALRGLFLIDSNKVIRHMLVNDLPLGRSIDEVLRMINALIFFEENGEVCPAGWQKGKPGIVPTKEGIDDYLTSESENL